MTVSMMRVAPAWAASGMASAAERLTWALDGVLSDQPVNVFAVEQPDNLQRTRLLVTGPTLALRPTPRTRLLLRRATPTLTRNRPSPYQQ